MTGHDILRSLWDIACQWVSELAQHAAPAFEQGSPTTGVYKSEQHEHRAPPTCASTRRLSRICRESAASGPAASWTAAPHTAACCRLPGTPPWRPCRCAPPCCRFPASARKLHAPLLYGHSGAVVSTCYVVTSGIGFAVDVAQLTAVSDEPAEPSVACSVSLQSTALTRKPLSFSVASR